MGKRAAVAATEEEAAKLSKTELDRQIAWAEFRARSMTHSGLRKRAQARLEWLKLQREKLYGNGTD
jgi:hypothetical protein